MKLLDYTIEGGFLPQIKCDGLAGVLDQLVARLLVDEKHLDPAALVAEVMRREVEGSTAIGGGLVIPHARFEGLDRVHIGVATLSRPLDLQAEDHEPVDVVILMLGPAHDTRQMLRVLARLARLVKRDAFLTGLREAPTAADLRDAFSHVDQTA